MKVSVGSLAEDGEQDSGVPSPWFSSMCLQRLETLGSTAGKDPKKHRDV
jgi:hypothetical protein